MKTCPTCRVRYPDALDFCPHDGVALEGGRPPPGPLNDRLLDTVIDGRYRVESKLGEGGMGVVYAARHVIIDKRVAIKVLKQDAHQEETAGQRFIQEARAASKIGHQNVVDITDFGSLVDGSAYFVMEFLEGKTLGDLLEEGPLSARRSISIAAQIARGLQAAHKHSIIHRDLKPENIFLVERDTQPDQVKLVDFGIAKIQTEGSARLTQAGMVLGTPEYMAPEAATGKETDHRVDEYSLGCLLYEMLTGDVPFKGSNSAATLTKHVFDPVVPPRRRRPDLDIPAVLEAVVLKAMAKKPDDRYPVMRDLLEALDLAGQELADVSIGVRMKPRDARTTAAPRLPAPTSSYGSARRPGRNRPAWTLGLLGGLAVALAFAGWFAIGAGDAARAADPTPVADATSPVAAAAAVPTADPAPRADVMLTLRSDPPGAAVYLDGERIGATPLAYPYPRSDRSLEFAFRLAGHREVARTLVPDGDHDVEISLPPTRPPRPVHAGRDHAPSKKRGSANPVTDLRDPFQ